MAYQRTYQRIPWSVLVGVFIVSVFASSSDVFAKTEHRRMLREPETGVLFPVTRRWGRYNMLAVGTAVREKFTFDVYAGCLYLDRQIAKEKLKTFLASSAAKRAYRNGRLDEKKIQNNEAFYRWLVNADLPLSIDMTFVRDVPARKIRAQYRESLLRSMKPSPALEAFVTALQVDIKKWQHITVNMEPGGRIILQYAGKKMNEIKSLSLSRAILKIYFGRRPINDSIKRSLVQNIDQLLLH